MHRLRAIHGAGLLLAVACGALVSTLTLTQNLDRLFDSDALYRLDLRLSADDWDTLKEHFRDDDYYQADLRWNGVEVRRVGIRSRGLGSRNGRKPGLRVDMDRYVDGQTFLGLGSIVLDNLTQDGSGIRERVAMRFYERMGLPAPREAHVRLYVNDRYAGLYAVVEPIDKDFLARVFGMREARVFGRNEAGVENDGYLFEYEWSDVWGMTERGPGLEAYRTLLDPVTHEDASDEELYAPIAEMIRAINETPDAEFESVVGRYLDLPLFMRHVAAQNFVAQWDGVAGYAGVNNFYLYRFEDSTRSRFILWDEDNAFRAPDFPVLEGHDQNVLVRRAMAVPRLREVYLDSLLEAAALASGWLEEEIRQQHRLIDASMREDTFRPFTSEDFDAGIQQLLDVAAFRPGFVRAEVSRVFNSAGGAPR